MTDTKEQREKYILVGIFDRNEEAAEASLSELAKLSETAGADASDPDVDSHMEVVYKTLMELEVADLISINIIENPKLVL